MNFKHSFLVAIFTALPPLHAQTRAPAIAFDQFPVQVFDGKIKLPPEFHKDSDGSWKDELGKPASAPGVNFAGEYYLAAHSCGTCCRFYTLDNLRTRARIDQIKMFDAAEPAPTTKDGHTYIPILYSKPGSRLLVVQYELDLCTPAEENLCRQRYYVLEDGRLKAISKTLQYCSKVSGDSD